MLSEFRSTNITWDKATSRIYSPVTANESDENGRKLVVQIVNGGQVEDLTGATLHLYWETIDKLHDGLDVFKAVDLKKGEFELSYTTGMLSNKGVLNANLVLIDTVGRVVSERFKITVKEGIDNDAIQSSDSFTTLTQALITIGPRLNAIDARLQQTLKKGNVSVDDINKNLGKFDETYMTDEFLQQMAGDTPINAVPADKSITQMKLTDKAVATSNTDFFTGGKNLFNKYAVTKGYRISGGAGTLIAIQGVNSSEFIDVLPSTSYYRSHTEAYAIYDIDGVYISGRDSSSANKVISIPSNGAKVRLSVKDVNIDAFQFEKGAFGTDYEMYKGVLSETVRIKEKSLPEINLNMTNFGHLTSETANLVDPDGVTSGLITADGSITANTAYKTTDYIYVKDILNLMVTGTQSGAPPVRRAYTFFGKNKSDEVISASTDGPSGFINPLRVPENAYYVRLSFDSSCTDYQVEHGTIASPYVPFVGKEEILPQLIPEKSLPEINLNMTNFGHLTSETANLVDPQEVREGLIKSDGSIAYPHVYYNHTGFIYVKDRMTVTVTGTQSGAGPVRRSYAFYDVDKTFIGGFTDDPGGFANPLNIPANAYFARFSFDSSCTDYQVEYGSSATTYTAFNPKYEVLSHVLPDSQTESNTPFSDNILVTNGDSITFGTTGTIPFVGGNYDNQVPWPQFVSETLKMRLSNHAIGGCTIAVRESSPTDRNPIVTRYDSMADGDVIIIAGGSNDWIYDWTPLGDMSNRSNFTFYGALHNLCLGLLEKYKGKQIVFTTPIKRGQSRTQETVNANGKTLNEYGEIIKEVCGYYGIPVIDMYNECTINPNIDTQRSEFIPDTVHPNRAGHEVMARRVVGYLRQLA